MNDKRKVVLPLGEIYKSKILRIPGGAGRIAWDTFNGLNPIQTVVWLKICETAYKTRDAEGLVVINELWMERNFESTSEWESVINAILDLEDFGYIHCDIYNCFISITIDYDALGLIALKLGRIRSKGIRYIKKEYGKEEILDNICSKSKRESFLRKIIDKICE